MTEHADRIEKSDLRAAANRLRARLQAVGDHQRSVWLGEGVGLLLAVLVPSLGLAMALDNLAHLPAVLRTLLLAAWVVGGVLLIRHAVRLLSRTLTPEQLAVKVEQRYPDIDNRLINSLLLSEEDDEEAYELIREVIEEGSTDLTRVNVNDAVPKRRMRLLMGGSALAVVAMVGYAAAFPEHFTNALGRMLVPFGGPPPLTRTRINDVTPKDKDVLSGDTLTIAASFGGVLPQRAEVFYTPEADETKILAMHAEGEAHERFVATMSGVSQSFEYYVAAGDAGSETYRITVHHRPVVSELRLKIVPPSYAREEPFVQRSGTVKALVGSTVNLEATCSKALQSASLELSTQEQPASLAVDGKTASGSFTVQSEGSYRIHVTDTFGFENQPVDHYIELIADEPPEIELAEPPPTITVKPDDTLAFKAAVRDRYGIQSAAIVQVVKEEAEEGEQAKPRDVALWQHELDAPAQRTLEVDEEVRVEPLQIAPGKSGILQVVATDWTDVTGPGVGRSREVVVTVMTLQQAKDEREEQLQRAVLELAEIIKKQRRNLALGKALRRKEIQEPGIVGKSPAKVTETTDLQGTIRADTGALIERLDESVPMQAVLRSVYEAEMVTAVEQLKSVPAAQNPAETLAAALETERVILARLTGRSKQLQRAAEMQGMQDLFAALKELLQEQKKIREKTAQADGPQEPLADKQDALGGKVIEFKELVVEQARRVAQSDEDAAAKFNQAAEMVGSRKVRSNMIRSASKLAKGELEQALPIQDKVLADLRAIEEALREPVAAKAAKQLDDLSELVEDAREKAKKLAELQARIKEISEELERSKDLTDAEAKKLQEKLAELEDLRDRIKDSLEKMAKDLNMFPEIPACNEMVEQTREVFEDVEQAPGSEEEKEAVEIAVDRDEGMLDAMKKIEERMGDMEMWLRDKPDGERWKQEGWDVEEIPDIPLVDLPEEMEDIVGEMVDKQEELDQEAQDSTSNAMVPDLPAGWDIADGPISSFGAKGKSGNEKPNDNEMTGRSGAGREGQADGEMVEGTAKNLEGREPEARRTRDPFQEGEVAEEEGGHPQKAKATGGGKQSGAGGEGGLRGAAPARDELKMRELERRQRQLRRNTEAVYSKATLMYLPTGELDAAIIMMQKAEELARKGDFAGFNEIQKRIVHALKNTERRIAGQGAVEMDPRLKLPAPIREEMADAKDEPIPPEYEKLVAEYYKAIAEGRVK